MRIFRVQYFVTTRNQALDSDLKNSQPFRFSFLLRWLSTSITTGSHAHSHGMRSRSALRFPERWFITFRWSVSTPDYTPETSEAQTGRGSWSSKSKAPRSCGWPWLTSCGVPSCLILLFVKSPSKLPQTFWHSLLPAWGYRIPVRIPPASTRQPRGGMACCSCNNQPRVVTAKLPRIALIRLANLKYTALS